MLYTQVPANTFETLQMNAGIITDNFTPATGVIGNILGATTGGLTFNSNPEYTDFGADIDNVHANTWQLKHISGYDPALSGNFMSITSLLAKMLAGAGAYATGDTTHIIPSHKLTEDDFKDFWAIGDYSANNNGVGTAGYVAIHIMHGLNTGGFQWSSTKDGKGQFAFDFHGHYDMTDIDTVPFEIYVKAGTGTLAALTVTSVAGTETGDTKITVSGYTLGSGESYVYKTAESTAPSVAWGDNVSTWTALTSGSDITPTSGHTKITVAVKDSNGEAVGSGSATLTVNS